MNRENEILENWLPACLPAGSDLTLLDVGAFHGDFSAVMLGTGRFGRSHLFEPNPQTFTALRERFATDRRVIVHNLAAGEQSSEIDFFCSADAATGSSLAYVDPVPVQRSRVPQTSLDEWWDATGRPRVDLIKIDTQGADLRVLAGSRQLVAAMQPWLVVEMLFIPRYHGQASPGGLVSWMEERAYIWAGLFNEHRTATGRLAFADVVFAPAHTAESPKPPFFARPSLEALQQEVEALQRVCAERLNLIEYLHTEAAKRLTLIETLSRPQPR